MGMQSLPSKDDEDFLRFHQSYKRSKAAARFRDEETSSLKLALEASQGKEKYAVAKLAAAENLKLKWVKWWGEEKDRAGRLEQEFISLRTETQAAERALRNKIESELTSLKDTTQRSESEKAALQEQLSDMEAKHKELLEKFNDYKKRVRTMGNEF
jgi:chromosome segregation ATPase